MALEGWVFGFLGLFVGEGEEAGVAGGVWGVCAGVVVDGFGRVRER